MSISQALLIQGNHVVPITLTYDSFNQVVTGTSTGAHGLSNGSARIFGASPTGYNGTFTITVTSSTQFTYPLISPGTSSLGFSTPATVTASGTTFTWSIPFNWTFSVGDPIVVTTTPNGSGLGRFPVATFTPWNGIQTVVTWTDSGYTGPNQTGGFVGTGYHPAAMANSSGSVQQ